MTFISCHSTTSIFVLMLIFFGWQGIYNSYTYPINHSLIDQTINEVKKQINGGQVIMSIAMGQMNQLIFVSTFEIQIPKERKQTHSSDIGNSNHLIRQCVSFRPMAKTFFERFFSFTQMTITIIGQIKIASDRELSLRTGFHSLSHRLLFK